MGKFFELLLRGLFLRCPVCGQGKLFKQPFKMNERCPHCGLLFEREEGYYTGSMAINLVISEFLIAAFTIPLAANPAVPLNLLLLWGAPSTIILPLLFFHHSRGLWLSMDHYLHPVERQV